MFKLDTLTKKIIFFNVIVYLITLLAPALIYKYFALHLPESDNFSLYQFVSYQFIHDTSPLHLIFNMLMLLVFGSIVETDYPGKLLPFYLICGLVAGITHNLTIDDNLRVYASILNQDLTMVGASGAVWGIMAIFAFKNPNEKLYPFFLPFGFKTKWILGIFFLIELFSAFSRGDNVSHFAHIGGAIAGLLIAFYYSINKK
jgi:membrane associated rhomboid family serine protease